MIDRRMLLGTAALVCAAPAMSKAAEAPESEADRRMRTDWPWLGRYADDNRRLAASGVPTNIVFLGDSITEGWRDKRPDFFTAGRVNRGIGGQTTPQMLLRMMADVVALRPRWLHLMAGTNDVAGNTGPMTVDQSIQNLTAMCQLARANGIGVLLASIPPAAHFPWRPVLGTTAPIRAINAWSKTTAATLGATYVDYWQGLADPVGGMKPGLAYDGVHPTEQGYRVMQDILAPMLGKLGL